MARNQVADTTTTSSKKASKKTEATSPKSKTKTKNKNTKNNTIDTNTNANEYPKPSTSNQIQHQEEEIQVEVEAHSKNNNNLSNKKEDKKKKQQNNNKKKKADADVDEEEENKNNESALYNFPMNRISRIVKAESDVRITQEALFLINKASAWGLTFGIRGIFPGQLSEAMAEGTRFQELIQSTDARITELSGVQKESVARIDGRIDAIDDRLGHLHRSVAEMNTTLQGIMLGVQKMQDKGEVSSTIHYGGICVFFSGEKEQHRLPAPLISRR